LNGAFYKTALGEAPCIGIVCAVGQKLISRANQGSVMPSGLQLTTAGLFQVSQNEFLNTANQCAASDLNNGIANMAMGLFRLNKALLAELTQMSQDIAALKAEVATLKSKPSPHLFSHNAFAKK
jgi:hypothetical protein